MHIWVTWPQWVYKHLILSLASWLPVGAAIPVPFYDNPVSSSTYVNHDKLSMLEWGHQKPDTAEWNHQKPCHIRNEIIGASPEVVPDYLEMKPISQRINPNIEWMHIAITWKTNIRSGYNLTHATTTELSWHVQNCDQIGSLKIKIKVKRFSQNFYYELMKHLWNRSLVGGCAI